MKRTLLVIIALIFSGITKAQFHKGDFGVSFMKKLPLIETKSFDKELYGIEVEHLASDWLGLNYTLYANDDVIHMPSGFVAGLGALALLSSSSSTGADIDSKILLYAFAIPEGLSFNLQVVNNVYLSPYINPLGLDYAFGKDNEGVKFENQFSITGASGIKFKGLMNIAEKTSIVLTAFAEGHTQYVADKEYGVRAGFGLGFVLN